MLLRQVQARALQGHHLRALRRRGDPFQGPPRADGPHRARRPGDPHLVLQGCAQPAGLPARPRPEGPGEGHLLRGVHDHRGRRRRPAPRPVLARGQDRPGAQAPRGPPRHPARRARQEARGGPRGPGGRGRQGRRAPQGQGRRRARDEAGPRPVPARAGPSRRGVEPLQEPQGPGPRGRRAALPRDEELVRQVLRGPHGRHRDPEAAADLRPRGRGGEPARDHRHRQGPAQGPRPQAAQGGRRVPQDHQQPAGHGPGRRPGHPAGPAPDGAARRWPVRDLRPQRPVPPGDQPQQPAQAAAGPRRPRDHRQQREADAPGGRRLAVRQRPPRASGDRAGQPAAEVALGHAQGQAGPVPPEPARQARRLLRPLGHRGRPAAQAAPVRSAQADGARAVQAVRDEAAGGPQPRAEHQERQADGRACPPGRVGRAGGGHHRAPGAAQPRTDAAPPRHPGLRAAADRGQGHPDPPARLLGVQRRLRRRPDGGAPAAVGRGAGRGADPDALDQQHPQAVRRPSGHHAHPGHDHRAVLPDPGDGRRAARPRARVLLHVGGGDGPRPRRDHPAEHRSRSGFPQVVPPFGTALPEGWEPRSAADPGDDPGSGAVQRDAARATTPS